ncbi:MFS transporter (plasmid) [Erwinia sp. E602]|uniref:MFS transporter n=1 Tax=unclassified Erwinia TaxID=2622719 RepID=UPI000C759127|nr:MULTISPECIES: MFS transporter [unclassified Erwinia]PLV63767.1 MFS transporter [Erwinia sp. B116]QUG73679.1 MFS transporter [Erwinia sp. E602]
MTQQAMTAVEKSAIRKISWRLVPFVALMFFINFLDRTAISFAGPNGMTQDLGLTAVQFGLASGIFFIGYILLEVPSNMALHRFGARRWLARIMISWGIVSLLFTWVSSVEGLYTLRVLLGIAEAGFFPGAILYLSMWVPARHRSKILSLFYLAQPLTVVFGAPLAAAFIEQHGLFGLEGWRVMFMGVSLPAIIIGIVALFWLVDSPRQAKWLTSDEKEWLSRELEAEHNAKQHKGHQGVRSVIGQGRVWVLCLIYFGFIYGLYALAFFLPTIIGGFQQQFGTTFNVMEKGLVTGVPYLIAAIVMFFWSRDASRRGCKTWHIALPALTGAISVPLALYMDSPFTTILVIAITASSIFAALPNFWTLPTQFLTGASAAAAIALINTLGNVAGFSAGYITGALHDATHSYTVPMFVVGGFMLLSAVLMVLLNRSRQPQPASIAQEQ